MVSLEIVNALKEARSIAILPHVSLDGDCLGGSLGFALALEAIGKTVRVVTEEKKEERPETYDFLPGQALVTWFEGETGKYDIALALDTGDRNRLGKRVELFDRAEKRINIDHHVTNTRFGELNLVDPAASSVCEMVYRLVKMLGLSLNKEIATCLYTGIATDTGGFRYSNTTGATHQVIAELINHGADVPGISQRVFETTSLERVKLMAAMLERLEILAGGRLAVLTVDDGLLKKCGAGEDDSDGVINVARNIQGIEVAVLFKHRNAHETKVSLRSKSVADVSKIAGTFGGGGHARAAGCTMNMGPEEAKSTMLQALLEELGSKFEI